ncbi:Plug domain-containing protein, partial [Kitasatospora cinereorecta]
MNTRATFLMLSGLFFLRSHAQEQVKIDTTKAVSLQEVQITSVRGSEKLTHIPTSVTLVNAKQLQILSRTTSNISQLLEATVAGLGPSTGTYSNFGQYLRGRGMLIMLDGIPQSTPIRDGGVDMKTVNANDLRAVEVIKGAT